MHIYRSICTCSLFRQRRGENPHSARKHLVDLSGRFASCNQTLNQCRRPPPGWLLQNTLLITFRASCKASSSRTILNKKKKTNDASYSNQQHDGTINSSPIQERDEKQKTSPHEFFQVFRVGVLVTPPETAPDIFRGMLSIRRLLHNNKSERSIERATKLFST